MIRRSSHSSFLGAFLAVLTSLSLIGCSSDEDGEKADPAPTMSSPDVTPSETDSLISTGLDQLSTGATEEATQTFTAILASDPTNAYAHYNLGYLAHTAGDVATAVAHYTAAIESNKDFPEALYNLALISEDNGDIDGAITLFRRQLALVPDDPGGLWHLGMALQETGQTNEARELLERAYAIDPSLRP
jgi:tetratricopeptide (TPR) repeat protein